MVIINSCCYTLIFTRWQHCCLCNRRDQWLLLTETLRCLWPPTCLWQPWSRRPPPSHLVPCLRFGHIFRHCTRYKFTYYIIIIIINVVKQLCLLTETQSVTWAEPQNWQTMANILVLRANSRRTTMPRLYWAWCVRRCIHKVSVLVCWRLQMLLVRSTNVELREIGLWLSNLKFAWVLLNNCMFCTHTITLVILCKVSDDKLIS